MFILYSLSRFNNTYSRFLYNATVVIFFVVLFLFLLKLFEFHVLHLYVCMHVCNMSSLNSHSTVWSSKITRAHNIQKLSVDCFFVCSSLSPARSIQSHIANLCTSWFFLSRYVSLLSFSVHLLLLISKIIFRVEGKTKIKSKQNNKNENKMATLDQWIGRKTMTK